MELTYDIETADKSRAVGASVHFRSGANLGTHTGNEMACHSRLGHNPRNAHP